MAQVVVKTKLTTAQAAWLAAYVGKYGAISLSLGGWPATMDAAGTVTISERKETVDLFVSPFVALGDSVKADAPGWVAGWMVKGSAG